LGSFERVNGVVELNLGFFDPDSRAVPAATGKDYYILAPDGFLDGNFHFPIREMIGIEDIHAIDDFGHWVKAGDLY